MAPLTIDPALQSLITPLTAEEYAQLEANLQADGCLSPLVVWQETQTLLDGHNRLQLCEQHGLDYRLQEISLPDVVSAKLWILRNQRGRRNLTSNQISYSLGKEYELQKQQGKRTDLTSGKSYQKSPSTATQQAEPQKVSEKTIRNHAVYAKAIDTLADVAGLEDPHALCREPTLTQQAVKALAKMAQQHAPTALEALTAVQEARTPKQARQIVREATRKTREHDQWMDSMTRSHHPEDEWAASVRPKRTPPPILTEDLALEARRKRQEADCAREVRRLLDLCETYGFDVVERDVWHVVCATAAPAPVPPPEPAPVAVEEPVHLPTAVWQVVKSLQPCTNAAVAKALDKRPTATHKVLQSLLKQGKVKRKGHDYRVVDAPSS